MNPFIEYRGCVGDCFIFGKGFSFTLCYLLSMVIFLLAISGAIAVGLLIIYFIRQNLSQKVERATQRRRVTHKHG